MSFLRSAVYGLMSSFAVLGLPIGAKGTAPHKDLSNSTTKIKIYLPDHTSGFYRGTRFDWSGMIAELHSQGHMYFSQWFSRSDPSIHDFSSKDSEIIAGPCTAAVGPVEEFTAPLGYDEAKARETFVKIGVGTLRKPDDAKYDSLRLYDVVDSGNWQAVKKGNAIEFSQKILDSSSGYGYSYQKTIMLQQDRPVLVIEHKLINIGKRRIQTDVYDHNFLTIDSQSPGPNFTITLPFEITPVHPPEKDLVELRGNQIVYLKTQTGEDRVYTTMRGFSDSSKDYNIRIENIRTGAGVTITGNHALKNLALWSIRSVLAVEPFIEVSVEPGQTYTWTYEYAFRSLGSVQEKHQ